MFFYLRYVIKLALADLRTLATKDKTYQGSWKRRGGVGAFMMLARKWDRIEAEAEKHGWDLFAAVGQPGILAGTDTLADDLRDLRTYLLLVEAEVLARHHQPATALTTPFTHDDLLRDIERLDNPNFWARVVLDNPTLPRAAREAIQNLLGSDDPVDPSFTPRTPTA